MCESLERYIQEITAEQKKIIKRQKEKSKQMEVERKKVEEENKRLVEAMEEKNNKIQNWINSLQDSSVSKEQITEFFSTVY